MKRGLLLIGLFLIFTSINFVLAVDLSLTVSDINPSSVEANQDFTVGIQVLNSGEEDASNVILEVKYLGDDLELKEDKVTNISFLRKGGGMRNIIYNFHTSPDAVSGERTIKLKLSWGAEGIVLSQDYEFNFTIISDKPELTISGVKSSPEKVISNQDIILTIKVENYGEGIAKNVRVKLEDLPFTGTKEAYLGEIQPHEDLPARFILKAGSSGDYSYTTRVLYESYGNEKQKDFSLSLTIFKKSENYLLISFAVIILLVVSLAMYKGYHKKTTEK